MTMNTAMNRNPLFINFSNHPSRVWMKEELSAAQAYGHVVDMPFPAVNPEAGEQEIHEEAVRLAESVIAQQPSAVLCQGEYTLCFEVIRQLQKAGIPVLAACSERRTIETGNQKTSVFVFCRFRAYAAL